ncbi:protein C-mannosyl-transferase DPY19L3-like [Haliotis cracherodii]|uniref:protein C-mannosyl-transferase DPY19L3-like n=1 Tax=Haliotis cracherodii TaxID=6455 RepID=UPI0039E88DFF
MSDARRRKGKGGGRSTDPRSRSKTPTESGSDGGAPDVVTSIFSNVVLGVIMMCVCGYAHAWLMYTLHENRMWFTNIKEVEREISFRTESGLYYSYYKQMVNAPSISQGIYDLIHDKVTEHPSVINILERMNVYQEVVLAIMYRVLGVKMLPILFYIICTFALHALLVAALFTSAWILSGTWLAGVLTSGFYVVNRIDTTRVGYTIPLRESFSLPFLWVQVTAITIYFQAGAISKLKEKVLLAVILTFTFLFALCWQFNQFVFLLQVSTLFGVWILGIIPAYKVRNMLHVVMATMLLVCLFQFINKMILVSLGMSLVLASYAVMYIKGEVERSAGVIKGIVTTVVYSVLVLLLAGVITTLLKLLLQVDADDHIFKFLSGKFGYGNQRDFDSRLYLCLGAFNFLTGDTYERLTSGLVFPPYALCHAAMLIILVVAVIQNFSKPNESKMAAEPAANGKSQSAGDKVKVTETPASHILSNRPEVAYIAIQTLLFGLLAMSTLRMKYLWTPYMCVLGSVAFVDNTMWKAVMKKFKLKEFSVQMMRNSALIVVMAVLFAREWPTVQGELGDLREFYDPDTVELMEWINKDIPRTSSFTGSMQLLAGVKLCTERPITNHPHYEHKGLRIKTKELYQIYGKREPADVHAILKKHKSNYIILEDSICRAASTGCRVPDLIDFDNGQVPDNGNKEDGLEYSNTPRFCEQIRHDQPNFTKYFKKVFENKTFRVHQVL